MSVASMVAKGRAPELDVRDARQQVEHKLRHLLRFSDFMLIVPVVGRDDQFLLQRLQQAETDSMFIACYVDVASGWQVRDLLSAVLDQLPDHGSLPKNESGWMPALREQVAAMRACGQRVSILVDHAERLDDAVLELLMSLQLDDSNEDGLAPLILLGGGPALVERLSQPHWQARMAGRYHLLPLESSGEDMRSEFLQRYAPLDKQLHGQKEGAQTAGTRPGKGAFEDAMGMLRQSGGERADAVSVAALSDERIAPDKRAGERAAASAVHRALPFSKMGSLALVVLLALVIAVSAWQFFPESDSRVTIDEGSGRVSVPLAIGSQESGESVSTGLAERLSVQERTLQSAPASINIALQDVRAESQSIAGENEIAPVMTSDGIQEPVVVVQLDTGADDVPAPAPAPAPAPVLVAEKQVGAGAVKRERNARVVEDERELLGREGATYALQLIGARELSSAMKLVDAYPDNGQFRVFSTSFKGKPWYVVVYGDFSSRDEALRAIDALPSGLKSLRPWARSVQGVQNDIQK